MIDDELKEALDAGHATKKEYRDGQIISTAINFGIFALCALILLRFFQ